MTKNAAHPHCDSAFAATLRHWRKSRRLSQLALSLVAGISQRHLSFLESGRSRPGKETVEALAEALELSLRERNQLLKSAGFSAIFTEHPLSDTSMKPINDVVSLVLAHHEPFPALVVDRNWNLYLANDACNRLIGMIGFPHPSLFADARLNIYRLTFSDKGLAPYISNLHQIAPLLVQRLQREVVHDPNNAFLSELLDEVQSSAKVKNIRTDVPVSVEVPVIALELCFGDLRLNMLSIVSSFGTALDITASELNIETFFPADALTKAYFEQMSLVQ